MADDFESLIDHRAAWDSAKWKYYPADVIPMWVADMDFRAPDPVVQALQERIAHGVFGYQLESPALSEVLVERLRSNHNLTVAADQLIYTPSTVYSFNTVVRITGAPRSGVMVQTPAYPPFLHAPAQSNRVLQTVPLVSSVQAGVLHYEIDFDALEAAVTPETRLFVFCNPHNPVGRVYTRAELEKIADFCLRHNLIICSDEIHCDLVYEGNQHISIASLSPEIADRCITLIAPNKTFNLPGVGCGVAIVHNATLRAHFRSEQMAVGVWGGALDYVAATAAYRDGQPWLDAMLTHLQGNRDFVVKFIQERLPTVTVTQPQGTYLAWLDFRALNLAPDPYNFFLEKARVALSNGADFNAPGFVRLNYATTRSLLTEALERMYDAVAKATNEA